MAARPTWRTRTVAFGAMLVVQAAALFQAYPALTGVLYRRPGSDWLTYESFARDMLEAGSLAGGTFLSCAVCAAFIRFAGERPLPRTWTTL